MWSIIAPIYLTAAVVAGIALPDIHARAHPVGATPTAGSAPWSAMAMAKEQFNDEVFTGDRNGRKRIGKITIGPCAEGVHLSFLQLEYGFDGHSIELGVHGTMPQGSQTAVMQLPTTADRITKVRLTTWKAKVGTRHFTRIGWMEVTTTVGTIACGANNEEDIISVLEHEDAALVHFAGSQGDALDSLQGFFSQNATY